MTSKDSLPSSTSLEELTTPISSMQSPEQQEKLLAVLEMFKQRDLWEALERVLRLEQLWHLREAAFSSNDDPRYGAEYHRHVASWLESVLNGALQNYKEQSDVALMSESERETKLTDLLSNGAIMEKDSGADYLNE